MPPDTRPGAHPDPLPDGADSTRRLEASSWQGVKPRYPEATVGHAVADLVLSAWLGRMTGYLSPGALGVAWFDWACHLMLSPDKQHELFTQGLTNLQRWFT